FKTKIQTRPHAGLGYNLFDINPDNLAQFLVRKSISESSRVSECITCCERQRVCARVQTKPSKQQWLIHSWSVPSFQVGGPVFRYFTDMEQIQAKSILFQGSSKIMRCHQI